jgi:hypothetical protein
MRQISRIAVTASAWMRRVTAMRRTAATVVPTAFVMVGAIVAAPSAIASSHVFPTMNDSGGLYWRSGTNWNTPISKAGYGVYPGTKISVSCYQLGTANVPGSADAMWVKASWASGPGTGSGWINEHFINDGAPINKAAPGVPSCTPPVPIPNLAYNRSAAVAWALANANDPQAYPAECTWFVSNALWQGGFSRTAAWTSSGSHGIRPVSYRPGTVDAWAVPNFKDYFLSHYSATWTSLGDMSVNPVPAAEPGDIIVYSWDRGKTLEHMAFVVGIAPGQYPEVAEWGTPDWTPWNYAYYEAHHPREGYQKRGWTWSQKAHKYLQVEYKGSARAYLLHINGGVFSSTF